MRTEFETLSDAIVLHVIGRVDGSTAGQFEKSVTEAARVGDGALVLDFEGVEYISSAGLRVLLIAIKAMSQSGRKLIVAAPRADVIDVINLTGFQRILTIVPSIAEAIEQAAA